MRMIYRLTHTTTYQYGGHGFALAPFLRLQPRELLRQRCLQNELQIEPRPDVICPHLDYFGNPMTFVTIEGSHRKAGHHLAERGGSGGPARSRPSKTPAWETVRDLSWHGEGERVFATHANSPIASPLIKKQPELASYASGPFQRRRCSRPCSI